MSLLQKLRMYACGRWHNTRMAHTLLFFRFLFPLEEDDDEDDEGDEIATIDGAEAVTSFISNPFRGFAVDMLVNKW